MIGAQWPRLSIQSRRFSQKDSGIRNLKAAKTPRTAARIAMPFHFEDFSPSAEFSLSASWSDMALKRMSFFVRRLWLPEYDRQRPARCRTPAPDYCLFSDQS